MNLYESMSMDAVLEFVTRNVDCLRCNIVEYCENDANECQNCGQVRLKYLKDSESELKPRYSVIKCDDDIDALYKSFEEHCDSNHCGRCKYYEHDTTTADCFRLFLKEKTIVPINTKG